MSYNRGNSEITEELEATGFTKENLDKYLSELGKEYRRLVGKRMPAEIILVGGAAVLSNYEFRDMTQDVDAIIHAASAIKDAAHKVGEKYNLPYDWLNADFQKTTSFTPKLELFSKYYRQFSNVLTVRTVSAEYLIAMKLCAMREYKKDISDIVGILNAHEKAGNPISLEQIQKAATNLYGSWEAIPQKSREYVEVLLVEGQLEKTFKNVKVEEEKTREMLTQFEKNHPNVVRQSNINQVIQSLRGNITETDQEMTSVERIIAEKTAEAARRAAQQPQIHKQNDREEERRIKYSPL